MTIKRENQFTITSININFYNLNNYIKRKNSDIVDTLLKEKSTFYAIQEFGSKSSTTDVSGHDLQKNLECKGYLMIAPLLEAKFPVNTRLFYKATKATLIEELSPIYRKGYKNRQCGGLFKIGDETVALYSLHLPLFSRDEDGKKEFWDCIIDYAKSTQNKNVILAGDFNESKLQPDPTSLANKINKLEKYFTEASNQEPTWNQKKLDHIFISPSLVNNMTIHSPIENTISDHKGLKAGFLLP